MKTITMEVLVSAKIIASDANFLSCLVVVAVVTASIIILGWPQQFMHTV